MITKEIHTNKTTLPIVPQPPQSTQKISQNNITTSTSGLAQSRNHILASLSPPDSSKPTPSSLNPSHISQTSKVVNTMTAAVAGITSSHDPTTGLDPDVVPRCHSLFDLETDRVLKLNQLKGKLCPGWTAQKYKICGSFKDLLKEKELLTTVPGSGSGPNNSVSLQNLADRADTSPLVTATPLGPLDGEQASLDLKSNSLLNRSEKINNSNQRSNSVSLSAGGVIHMKNNAKVPKIGQQGGNGVHDDVDDDVAKEKEVVDDEGEEEEEEDVVSKVENVDDVVNEEVRNINGNGDNGLLKKDSFLDVVENVTPILDVDMLQLHDQNGNGLTKKQSDLQQFQNVLNESVNLLKRQSFLDFNLSLNNLNNINNINYNNLNQFNNMNNLGNFNNNLLNNPAAMNKIFSNPPALSTLDNLQSIPSLQSLQPRLSTQNIFSSFLSKNSGNNSPGGSNNLNLNDNMGFNFINDQMNGFNNNFNNFNNLANLNGFNPFSNITGNFSNTNYTPYQMPSNNNTQSLNTSKNFKGINVATNSVNHNAQSNSKGGGVNMKRKLSRAKLEKSKSNISNSNNSLNPTDSQLQIQAQSKSKKRGKWSEYEDKMLQQLAKEFVARNEKINFRKISDLLPGRTAKQCREHWLSTLNPDLKKGRWTKPEEIKLLDLMIQHGKAWSVISKEISGRAEHSVKAKGRLMLGERLKVVVNPNELGKDAKQKNEVNGIGKMVEYEGSQEEKEILFDLHTRKGLGCDYDEISKVCGFIISPAKVERTLLSICTCDTCADLKYRISSCDSPNMHHGWTKIKAQQIKERMETRKKNLANPERFGELGLANKIGNVNQQHDVNGNGMNKFKSFSRLSAFAKNKGKAPVNADRGIDVSGLQGIDMNFVEEEDDDDDDDDDDEESGNKAKSYRYKSKKNLEDDDDDEDIDLDEDLGEKKRNSNKRSKVNGKPQAPLPLIR